jgi:transcriptional regulator with XRE-family HTH domain
MGWESFDIDQAEPMVVVGTRLLGAMVKRRRVRFGISQRQLARLARFDQSVISRLENGLLRGIRYRRFAILVALLGGLDENAPAPRWYVEQFHPSRSWAIDSDAVPFDWMPARPAASPTDAEPRTVESPRTFYLPPDLQWLFDPDDPPTPDDPPAPDAPDDPGAPDVPTAPTPGVR